MPRVLILSLLWTVALPESSSPTDQNRCFSETDLTYIWSFVGKEVARPQEPIRIDVGHWYSSVMDGEVAHILLSEVLGYNPVLVRNVSDMNPNGTLQRLAAQDTDVNFEVWLSKDGPGTFQPSVQSMLDKKLVFSGGPLGATGTQGWFVPTPLVKLWAMDNVDVDFWRSYSPNRTLKAYQILDGGGTVNDTLQVAPPFFPAWCLLTNNASDADPACTQFIGIFPEWGEGALPQIITNQKFRFTVAYVGDNIDEVILERLGAHKPAIFFYWYPTQFLSKYSQTFTRVALPPFSEACYANNTGDPTGAGSVDCDYPPVPIFKMYSKRLRQLDEISANSTTKQSAYTDLLHFIEQFSLTTSDLEWMLSRVDNESMTFDTACQWLKSCTQRKPPSPAAPSAQSAPSFSSFLWSSPTVFWPPTDHPTEPIATLSPTIGPSIPPTPFPGILTCDWFGWLKNTPVSYIRSLPPLYVLLCVSGALVLCGVSTVMQLLLFKNRNHPVIRASAHRLCQLMVLGSYLGYAAVLVSAQEQSYRPYCILYPTLFGCSFVLVFGSVTLKNHRIDQIFNGTQSGAPKPHKPASDATLIQYIVMMMVCELALSMVWFAFNTPQVALTADHSDGNALLWSCSYEQNDWFITIYAVPKVTLVGYALWISWKVRNVNDHFNESPKLAFAAYTTVVFGALAFVIGFADIDVGEHFLIESMLILVGVASNVWALLIPKFWSIYTAPRSYEGCMEPPERWSPSASRERSESDPQVSRLRRRLVDSARQIEQLKKILKHHNLEIPQADNVDSVNNSLTTSLTRGRRESR